MTKRILVAYDGSDMSEEAVWAAKNQACETPKREIHMVSVVKPTGPITNATVARSIGDELAQKIHAEMKTLKEQIESPEIEVVTEVVVGNVEGNPGMTICEYADRHVVDLIVVGSRGLGNVKKLFLGSVSNNVVQHASCPVLVIK